MNFKVLCRPAGFLKLLQIAICITCLGLIGHYGLNFGVSNTAHSGVARQIVGITAFGGMVLVTVPLLTGLILGDAFLERSYLETMFNIVGLIMMITAGALAIETYQNVRKGEIRDAGLAVGSLGIINAILYFVDAFFAFRVKT